MICNDVFTDDFEETRLPQPVPHVQQKDYYENPYDIPSVKSYYQQELKMSGANPLKKEIASFIEVQHCQQSAVLFLKKNHFLVQSKEQEGAGAAMKVQVNIFYNQLF